MSVRAADRARARVVAAAGLRRAADDGVVLPERLRIWRLAGLGPDSAVSAAEGGDAGEPMAVVLERATSEEQRQANGLHVTPAWLADHLVGRAFDLVDDDVPSVCDPACGGGAFLLAAARAIEAQGVARPDVVHHRLWGADVDPVGLAAAELALTLWAGVPPPRGRLVVGDPLTSGGGLWRSAPADGFGAVVGNPPFLNQLGRATVRTAASTNRLRARFGAAVQPYTDAAWLFLLLACDLVRPGGVVTMVQPLSVMAARDGEAVRRAIDARATLRDLWVDDPIDRAFAASVHVCAPLLHATDPACRDGRRASRTEPDDARSRGPDPTARPDGSRVPRSVADTTGPDPTGAARSDGSRSPRGLAGPALGSPDPTGAARSDGSRDPRRAAGDAPSTALAGAAGPEASRSPRGEGDEVFPAAGIVGAGGAAARPGVSQGSLRGGVDATAVGATGDGHEAADRSGGSGGSLEDGDDLPASELDVVGAGDPARPGGSPGPRGVADDAPSTDLGGSGPVAADEREAGGHEGDGVSVPAGGRGSGTDGGRHGRGVGAATARVRDGANGDGRRLWAERLADAVGVPAVGVDGSAGRLGQRADVAAGFRDEYYGLVPLVREAVDLPDRAAARLVTAGALDWGRCSWGERPARFAKRTWQAPVVDVAAAADLPPDEPTTRGVRRWLARTGGPKVLVANQTRVVELAVDDVGSWVPSVPVLAVVPHRADDLWRLAAAVGSPTATAWLWRRAPGTALHRDALKVAAGDLAALPLPIDEAAWTAAAGALRATLTGDVGAFDDFVAAAASAYGAGPELVEWWLERLGRRKDSTRGRPVPLV